jgi:hypothetical protein
MRKGGKEVFLAQAVCFSVKPLSSADFEHGVYWL